MTNANEFQKDIKVEDLSERFNLVTSMADFLKSLKSITNTLVGTKIRLSNPKGVSTIFTYDDELGEYVDMERGYNLLDISPKNKRLYNKCELVIVTKKDPQQIIQEMSHHINELYVEIDTLNKEKNQNLDTIEALKKHITKLTSYNLDTNDEKQLSDEEQYYQDMDITEEDYKREMINDGITISKLMNDPNPMNEREEELLAEGIRRELGSIFGEENIKDMSFKILPIGIFDPNNHKSNIINLNSRRGK